MWWTPIPEAATADAIRQQVMTQRQAQGLTIVLQTPEGLTTLYPKDHPTKQAWIAAAQQRGYTLVDAEEGR